MKSTLVLNFKKKIAYSQNTTVILEAVNLNLQYIPLMKGKIALKPQKKKKSVRKIACWSIRSLIYSNEEDYRKNMRKPQDDERPLLVRSQKANIDILCLSETRLLDQNNLKIDRHVLLWSGKEENIKTELLSLQKKNFSKE